MTTHLMVTKGALAECARRLFNSGNWRRRTVVDIATVRDRIQQHFEEFSKQGLPHAGRRIQEYGGSSHA